METVAKQADGKAKKISPAIYDASDGIASYFAIAASPRLKAAGHGSLWLATLEGAALVDPARLRVAHARPAVVIEQTLVDHKNWSPASRSLEIQGQEMQFRYGIIAFSNRDQVHVRYRMEGRDATWTEAGNRRSATFFNLPPGAYRFVVEAISPRPWTSSVASVAFNVPPSLFGHWWSDASSAGALAIAVLVFVRVRESALNRRLRIAFCEQLRVARDLHDTVLQGFAGVVCQLQALSLSCGFQRCRQTRLSV